MKKFQRKLEKNYNLINKILVQYDSRYFDAYAMNILSYFIAKDVCSGIGILK